MRKLILSVLALFALAAVAEADCFRRVRVVEQPVLAQILVPAYGGSYGGQQQNDDVLRRLVEVLERLEGKLDGQADVKGGLTMETIAVQACASCHTAGKSPKAGFVILDEKGKLAEFSLGDKKLIALRVDVADPKKKMPPEKTLSEAAKRIVAEFAK